MKSREILSVLVKELSVQHVAALLAGQGLRVRLGPFNIRINSNYRPLVDSLYLLYANFELAADEIADFQLEIKLTRLLRQPFSRCVRLLIDGQSPFPAVSAAQAFVALEQGIKWVLAARTNDLLVLRAAVVERNGGALLLPFSGATNREAALCAVLAHGGYRLFSDTFGLMEPESRSFYPLPGLIALSNASFSDSRSFLPIAMQAETLSDTKPGALAYIRPSSECISRSREPAKARWIVLPQQVAKASPMLEPLPQTEVFLLLVNNSPNYETLGEAAFTAVSQLAKSCQCYRFVYSDFDGALAMLNELTDAT